MNIFTSDLHFAHKNIVKFTNRGVETTEEQHDEWLINRINEVVRPSDTLYHLGDLSFHRSFNATRDFVHSIRCPVILLKGNHDNLDMLHRVKRDCGNVLAVKEYMEIKIAGNSVVLFHFPIASWHKQGHGSWHLHGHSHGNLKEECSQGKILDVGLDNAYNLYGKHRLFFEEDIIRYMNSREAKINDNHRENI